MIDNTSFFLKVNLKDRGYTYIWSPLSFEIEESVVDSALPIFDTKLQQPCVGYTATRLSANKYLLIAGSHWAIHKDQHDRAGLSFWCGVVVDNSSRNLDLSWILSDYILGMLRQIETLYDQIGDIVADLAKKKQDEEWSSVIFKLMFQSPPIIDDFTKGFVRSVVEDKKHVFTPEKINIQSSFPLHSKMVVPYALALLVLEPDVNKIGGGDLLVSRLKDMQIISTPSEVKGYKKNDLNKFLSPYIGLPKESRVAFQKESRQANSSADDDSDSPTFGIGFIISLISFVLCIAMFVVFWFLR